MAKISRNWFRMNRDERLTLANNVIRHIENNPHGKADIPLSSR